ncbi:D-alanyl-D-alanine carboxypeptidase/D-alanyl-D-alanine endopeptidase [Granulicoccus phenolivorans]|uniref:D-alanyl-D-alanine carboxypeptidase/D-alanyl-D-alanine endopeptidase n=1 Tax=Granulicoccus phenolivorans TaxID=266854 RepID=UPI000417722B|nr:D-alanyl-D-alanine carboxypeptidase/D-alanyl-D-alanine-endopeptidase [Granulicoccus phenolivorans]
MVERADKTSRARPTVRWMIVGAVVLVVVLGAVTGGFRFLGERALYATGLWIDGGSPTIAPGTFDQPPDPAALPVAPGDPVLATATRASGLNAEQVTQSLRTADLPGGQLFGEVLDAADGRVLFDANGSGSGTPASTQKVLTTVAALQLYGPEHTFDTRSVLAGNQLWLVGGGDPFLTRDELTQHGQQAAAALKQRGVTQVQLGYDTSLFTGTGWNPDWRGTYTNMVTPTSSLWIDKGLVTPSVDSVGVREADPSRKAADVYAEALRGQGITVNGVTAQQAPASATEIATHHSRTLSDIVEQVLVHSDNDGAEVLFRQIGRSGGRSGSIADAQTATRETLQQLGVWTDGMKVVDGSGLSRENLTSPNTLTRAILAASQPEHEKLRPLITGMSVARAEGTLLNRFVEDGSQAGRGLVRGKTGTLTNVHSLAGLVPTRDGSMVVFAFIVNGEQDEYRTRVWLDRAATALATCGCRG